MQYSTAKTLLWLRNVEQLASDIYQAAALELKEDKEFSSFLLQMTKDEAWHFHVIGSAAQYFSERDEMPPLDIIVDSIMTKVLEVPFQDLFNKIADQSVTRQDVVDCIVKTEFSEWNHIFLYVVNTLRESSQTFEHAVGSMQEHEKRIEDFLQNLPNNIKIPDEFYKRPHIWKKKILIVEDDRSVRELFTRVLSELGTIETANNGQEAMDKLRDHFFNVVTSEIEMPVMNGIEFYEKALEIDPSIGSRFLFCSADITPEIETLCDGKNLGCLKKPVKIQALKQAVKEKMDGSL